MYLLVSLSLWLLTSASIDASMSSTVNIRYHIFEGLIEGKYKNTLIRSMRKQYEPHEFKLRDLIKLILDDKTKDVMARVNRLSNSAQLESVQKHGEYRVFFFSLPPKILIYDKGNNIFKPVITFNYDKMEYISAISHQGKAYISGFKISATNGLPTSSKSYYMLSRCKGKLCLSKHDTKSANSYRTLAITCKNNSECIPVFRHVDEGQDSYSIRYLSGVGYKKEFCEIPRSMNNELLGKYIFHPRCMKYSSKVEWSSIAKERNKLGHFIGLKPLIIDDRHSKEHIGFLGLKYLGWILRPVGMLGKSLIAYDIHGGRVFTIRDGRVSETKSYVDLQSESTGESGVWAKNLNFAEIEGEYIFTSNYFADNKILRLSKDLMSKDVIRLPLLSYQENGQPQAIYAVSKDEFYIAHYPDTKVGHYRYKDNEITVLREWEYSKRRSYNRPHYFVRCDKDVLVASSPEDSSNNEIAYLLLSSQRSASSHVYKLMNVNRSSKRLRDCLGSIKRPSQVHPLLDKILRRIGLRNHYPPTFHINPQKEELFARSRLQVSSSRIYKARDSSSFDVLGYIIKWL